jgi:hypothetical protein
MSDMVINIDINKKCESCHKGGATACGLCLGCIAKRVTAGEYDHILKAESKMGIRKLTDKELDQLKDELVSKENLLREAEERKGNFLTAINKELKGYEMSINSLLQQINSGQCVEDDQQRLPI